MTFVLFVIFFKISSIDTTLEEISMSDQTILAPLLANGIADAQ